MIELSSSSVVKKIEPTPACAALRDSAFELPSTRNSTNHYAVKLLQGTNSTLNSETKLISAQWSAAVKARLGYSGNAAACVPLFLVNMVYPTGTARIAWI